MARYSRARISRLLNDSDDASTADQKGEILEQLTRYIFAKVPGVSFYAKNILDGKRAQELDVVFWNLQKESDICFLDSVIIVECKNTKHPVSSAQVGWFVRKLQDRGTTHGILVALDGITGNNEEGNSAHSEVLSALIRDRIRVLVITREELLSLSTTDDLVSLLKEKILQLTLYKTIA
jgi:Restriction endonuclease